MNRKNNQLEFEDLKRRRIDSLSKCECLDQPFPEWENFLTLDYWKDWRNKISSFQTEKELGFYTDRLSDISYAIRRWKKDGYESPVMLFQYHYSREKHEAMSGMDPEEMIEQEELRLQNISWEDWQNEYKFSSKYLKINELSAEEMLNDSWFNEQINNLFDLKNGNLPRNKKRERQKHDPSVFQFSKRTGELNIFANKVNFNKFYQKKINQYQAGIDYEIKEEKIISVFNVYDIIASQLKKDIALIGKTYGPVSDINVDDVKLVKIINKEYRDYSGEEWERGRPAEKTDDNQNNYQLNGVEESNTNYQNWSRKKLVSAINLLKAESEELKNNQNLFLTSSSSEREERLQENQAKLEQLQNILHSLDNNNNPLPIIPIISTVGVAALLGLIIHKITKNRVRK